MKALLPSSSLAKAPGSSPGHEHSPGSTRDVSCTWIGRQWSEWVGVKFQGKRGRKACRRAHTRHARQTERGDRLLTLAPKKAIEAHTLPSNTHNPAMCNRKKRANAGDRLTSKAGSPLARLRLLLMPWPPGGSIAARGPMVFLAREAGGREEGGGYFRRKSEKKWLKKMRNNAGI